jgi:leader peptidase (prepilin peptidase)/N-methyltransferase
MTSRVAAATAVILGVGGIAVVTWRFWGSWALVPFLGIAVVGAALAWVDIRQHRLPNRIVLPALGVAVLLFLGSSFADGAVAKWMGAPVGAAVLFAFYLVLALISPRGMGMGDVKLAGLVGLCAGYLGVSTWIAAALAGFVVGGVVAAISLLSRRATARTLLPFGPSMIAGLWIAIALAG